MDTKGAGPHCPVCHQAYNHAVKTPIVLLCGHSVCKDCLQTILHLAGKLTCPLDKKEQDPDISKLAVNYALLELVDRDPKAGEVKQKQYCPAHPEKELEFRCKLDQTMICSWCLLDRFPDKKSYEICATRTIAEDFERLSKALSAGSDLFLRLKTMIDSLGIQRKTNAPSYEYLQKCYTVAHSLLLRPAEAINYLNPGYELTKLCIQHSKNEMNPLSESTILKPEEVEMVTGWLPAGSMCGIQLYKATRDGFSPEKFHEMCDNRGPTLTIAVSEQGKVFGGFTKTSFTSNSANGSVAEDDTAFIFSVSNAAKLPILPNLGCSPLTFTALYGPTYGCKMADLCISLSNDPELYCFSNLGKFYQCPQNMVPLSKEANEFLAGSKKFRVKDLEVYHISANY